MNFAIGHEPGALLKPQDETLFRAFQSNLLSLISHELRTPLMGILNALSMLSEDSAATSGMIPKDELLKMARQNANRLHRTMSALLDMAQLESGMFHARLREIDLAKTVRTRLDASRREVRDLGIQIEFSEKAGTPTLADPQKVVRVVDLCLQAILPRALNTSAVRVSVTGSWLEFRFKVKPELAKAWEQAWTQAQAGFQGGVGSPTSAFGGVMQSEQAFLTRQEEGLGNEFLLVHEIMRIHHGKFTEEKTRDDVTLLLTFSGVGSESDVRAILTSRAYDVSTELATVALVLMEVPEPQSAEEFAELLKSHLFRSSDAVYPLAERGQVALILDDCKVEDLPGLLARIARGLPKQKMAQRIGWAQCPADGLDPALLFDLAASRMNSKKVSGYFSGIKK